MRRVLAVALAVGLSSGFAAEPQQTSQTLTLATYNIHIGVPMGQDIGPYKSTTADLDNVSSAITSLNADVVALQEVDCEYGRVLPERRRSSQINQARYLASAVKYSYIFGSAQDDTGYPTDNPDYVEWGSGEQWDSNGGAHGEVGNALLSRLHVVGKPENIPLPRDDGQERRACIRAVLALRTPGSNAATADSRTTSIVVYATHFQHNSADTRLKQMQAVLDRIKAEPAGTLVFLLGDLNHEYSATEAGNPIRLALESGLYDLGAPAPGELVAEFYTFPADAPTRRIDYIFTNQPLQVTRKTVHRSLASDHLPLAVTVQLPDLQ